MCVRLFSAHFSFSLSVPLLSYQRVLSTDSSLFIDIEPGTCLINSCMDSLLRVDERGKSFWHARCLDFFFFFFLSKWNLVMLYNMGGICYILKRDKQKSF